MSYQTSTKTQCFVLSMDFFSEPNYKGNMTRYYLKGFPSANKVSYGSIGQAKRYHTYSGMVKAGKRLQKAFPNARITMHGETCTRIPTESTEFENLL